MTRGSLEALLSGKVGSECKESRSLQVLHYGLELMTL